MSVVGITDASRGAWGENHLTVRWLPHRQGFGGNRDARLTAKGVYGDLGVVSVPSLGCKSSSDSSGDALSLFLVIKSRCFVVVRVALC